MAFGTTEERNRKRGSTREWRAPAWIRAVFDASAPLDGVLLATIVALVAFGVVMVYSASAVFAHRDYGSGQYFLLRQSIFAGAGLVIMFALARFDYRQLRKLTYPILVGAIGLLLALALGFGRKAGGASRWIQVGSVNIQPSEVAKLALILWLAYSLSKKTDRMRTFTVGFLPHVLMAGVLMLLCLMQPDFGSAVMIGLLTFTMLFAAGAKLGYLLGGVLLALPAAYGLIASSEYRMRRIKAFLAPFEYRQDEGYQISESLISFGSGGTTGVGLGDGRQKLFFLPEAHTDFISAIIGEELGFVGIAILMVAFAVVIVRGVRAAYRAPDDYGTYIAVGVTMFIGLQAYTNLAVAMGMLPTKGLVLPFISYGGSALLVNLAAVGILLNVSRDRGPRTARASEPGAVPSNRPSRNHGRALAAEGAAT